MEDQQPATSDLTNTVASDQTQAEPAVDDTTTNDADSETDSATDEAGEVGETATDDNAATTEAESTTTKSRTGRWAVAVVALLSALFVGSAAFAGATVQPYLAQGANVEIKLKVARAAANAITTLWTYTPDNMETLSDRAANYLTGDFGAQYRKYIDQIAAPNKQAKVTNNTEVTGVAVETLRGSDATVIVYTNTTTTSPLTKNIPSLKYLAYLLTMKYDNGRWKVIRMNTVTSLDVTPHL